MRRLFFYAQGCVRKLAALLHAPRAASRGKSLPYSIAQGCVGKLAALLHAPRAASRGKSLPYSIAHGHPKEKCQQELTGARRASRGINYLLHGNP